TNGSYALNLSVQTDGVYNITAISYDLAGNTNLSTINLTIDTISPLAVIEFPESNSTLNSRTLIINFTLVEPNVNGTNLSIRNSTGDVVNSTTSSQNGSVQINLSVPEDGNYNLTFRAYDRAGNNASAVASNITVLTAPTLKIRPSWTETYYLGNATISAGELENTSTTRSLYLNLNQTKILQFFVNNSGVSALENLTAELYGFSNIEANLSWADGCNISEPRNVSAGEAVALNLTIHSNASGLSTGGIYISTLNGEPYPDLNMSLAVNSTNLTIVRLNSSSGIYYSNSTEEVEVEFWVYLYDNSTLDTSWLGAYNATLLNSSGEGAQNLTLSVLDGLFSVTLNTAGLLDGNYTLFGNWTDLNNNSVSLNQSLQLLTPVDIYATVLPNENMVVKGDNFTFRVNVTKSGTQAVGNGTVCIALPGDITNLSGGLCQHFTDSDGNFSMLLNWTLGTSARGTYPINISANFTDFRFDKDTQKNVSVKYGDLDLDWKYSSSDPPSGVDTSDSFYVRVQVTNEGDLNATSVGLEMTYSSSYFTRISGTNPCSLGTLVPNETEYCTWVLQAGSSTVSNSVIQVSVSSAQNATLPSAISRQVDVSVPSTQQTETTTTTTNTVAPTTTTTSIASATFIKPTFSDLTLFQGDDYSFIVNVKNNGTKKLNNLHLQVSGIDSAYYKLGSNTKTILNTGLSRDLNFTFTIPEGASAGTSAVVLKAVSDEGTWTKSINLNVRGFDLAVSGLENLSVTQGENKSVSFSIKNTGGKKLDNLSLSLQGMDTEKYTISPQVVSALAVDASQNCALSFSLPEDFEVGLANITLLVESTEKNFTRGLVLAVLPCEEGKSEILNEYKKLTESFERLLEDYERVDYEKANSTNLTSKVEIANQTMELINQSIERGDYLEASRLINEAQTSLNALESSIAEVKSPAGPGSTFLILVFVFGAMLVAAALFYTYSPKPKQKAGKGYYVPMPGEKEKEKQESTPNKGIKKYLAKFSKKAEQDKERKKIIEEWRKKYGPSK
ncbi:MAG: hypothetical protein JW727_00005, partial [Candidatus Aenigmarchaeota archaeon]|nr:hypothetical protein [Candidatus Aenigmarchaeota archaeon]